MSYFNTLLAQPDPGLQKPLPNAPSAPVPIAQPSSKASGTAKDPTNAFNSLLAASPPINPTPDLCESCHARTKYNDGTKTHDFCSKRCAATAQNKVNGTSSRKPSKGPAAPGNCDFCHTRPKFHDGAQTLSFCSKSCANDFKVGLTAARQGSGSTPANSKNQCKIGGCQQALQQLGNGKHSQYCSLAHQKLAETICIMCRSAAKQGDHHFCGKTCADEAASKGPIILEVPEGHATFTSVADQFRASWRHAGKVCPPVKAVYKIIGSQSSLAKYDAYRAAVEARGNFVSSGRSAGNENRRWHGTRRECKLGDKGNTKFCTSPTCSLCCIIKTSFDLSLFGKKTGWGRFGRGLYTSSTSSKSNDYSSNKSSSPYKAILLNKVVVGKGYKVTENNTSLTAPPSGYDSVLAEKGGKLNFDELILYNNDAIRPSFLVLYEAQ
ncbi:hypothetical protein PILCRDRAFT_73161 [Piloderma croceum F 1598]|uniref:PARP catalytic domain-containing protein n=1 Tax=Piloderma croceum (strain F 1598) TaxID=765440 RepID=A0A0C3BST9_PILCF|nr:hypothetical protein PILCRDRAFT_73161 [Piloderma croceum F 1598]